MIHTTNRTTTRTTIKRSVLWVILADLCLVGCSVLEPALNLQPGQSQEQVLQFMGQPNARHALEGGTTRLEFARGPAGRSTWMVEVDAQGRVQSFGQVLNEAHFATLRGGMTGDVLQRELGRPSHRQNEWGNKQTWSWRYPTNECVWFRITLGPDGLTQNGGGVMPDPSCDVNDRQGRE